MLLENIKKLCKARGVSIYRVERASGISPCSIYRWGEVTPSVDKVKAVADYFGVTVDELLTGAEHCKE